MAGKKQKGIVGLFIIVLIAIIGMSAPWLLVSLVLIAFFVIVGLYISKIKIDDGS